ncbi:MAG: flagellar biosynthetic protein FliO [Pseudomonadales bacterium]
MESFDPILGLLAFLFVIGLLLLTLWFLKSKTALGGSNGKSNLRIIDTLRIDPKNRVCVLTYGDKRLLLGISASNITLLDTTELDGSEAQGDESAAALTKPAFKEQLGALLGQTKD